MRSVVGGNRPGDFNLKGKKSHRCVCGCCDVTNFREEYEAQRVQREEMDVGLSDLYRDYVPADNPKEHAGLPDSDYDLVDTKPWDTEDRGEWEVMVFDRRESVGLSSSDFKFDVMLRVTGDFPSHEAHVEYAMRLAERLNRTIPE